ncbi:hypothetical protein KIPB_016985 [Kipferlia bialata]|uniref:Uncharacterized protein n=1 Tax=Kipferlia bialata TaxID=797122 RepID=A0A391NWA4_9EUKA|nr:hypothetical protein KIPB_016985 [Kipferlia bialata]|eukprot:g16985.t1
MVPVVTCTEREVLNVFKCVALACPSMPTPYKQSRMILGLEQDLAAAKAKIADLEARCEPDVHNALLEKISILEAEVEAKCKELLSYD